MRHNCRCATHGPDAAWHGSLNGYNYHGCKCARCQEAKSAHSLTRRVTEPVIRIPIQPIQEYVSRRGSFEDLVPDPLRQDFWRQRLGSANTKGWIDLFHADEFCCEVLRKHPAEIYGSDWFEFAPSTAAIREAA